MAKWIDQSSQISQTTPNNGSASKASLIWNIAELLRGGWKQHEYQDVILPLTLLKRLDSVLTNTKQDVLATFNQYEGKVPDIGIVLKDITWTGFYNTSSYDFYRLLDDQRDMAKNLRNFIAGFSDNVQQIFEKFDFEKQLSRMEGGNMLYLIIMEFNKVNLHPDVVSNHEMGQIFEWLIRKFSEQSNETAWEHYTPREVIQLMVEVLFEPDTESLKQEHAIKLVYDPCCGTGGMLSAGKDHIMRINPKASIYVYGQELNPITYAICKADMLMKGEDADRIKGGDKDHTIASTLSTDQFRDKKFDYILANPPYGVDWKKDKDAVEHEAERGFAGRFGAGLPRSSDGQLLFLQHMVSKMRNHSEGGARVGVVFNGSPLFTGDAGGGESEIRRWVCEQDYLEAIIALPDQLFYNTGISTYIWILTNRKTKERKGTVQLIDARKYFKKMRKSLGNKRNEISTEDIHTILSLYRGFTDGECSKIFKTTDFAYRQITIERPLYDENQNPVYDKSGKPKADSSLRDTENVPYGEDIQTYFEREVRPYVADAWIDTMKCDPRDGQVGKVGYEIPLTRYFYRYEAPRTLEAIEADIEKVENELLELMKRL